MTPRISATTSSIPSTLMMGYGFDPALSRRLAEAADLPHLDLRVRARRRRQALLRRHHRQAAPAPPTGWSIRASTTPTRKSSRTGCGSGKMPRKRSTFSSGMTAITTLFLTFVRPGDVIVHSGPLYAATETIINKILGQFGVKYVDFPAGATREEIDDGAGPRQGHGPRLADLPRKPGQPDQRPGRCRGGPRRPRRRVRRRRRCRRSRSTTPSSARCGRKPLDQGADISASTA